MNFSMSKKISDVVSSGYFKKTLYTLPTRCWVSIIVFLFTTSAEIHTFRCVGKFRISGETSSLFEGSQHKGYSH